MKGNQKLTDDQVRAIREEAHHGASGKVLAAKYGVSSATISQIRHGQTRQKVKPAEPAPGPGACTCTIEMATFRDVGETCLHCGRTIAKGGTL